MKTIRTLAEMEAAEARGGVCHRCGAPRAWKLGEQLVDAGGRPAGSFSYFLCPACAEAYRTEFPDCAVWPAWTLAVRGESQKTVLIENV